ncbi:MAG TPA: amidase [Candidatus Binataceae bacterium]|nr:amidase [Candidatus Binataceae bacterium]
MIDPFIEATELRALVLKHELRPREVAEFFLARVEKLNPQLGAFITITPERALADADRLEKLSRDEAAKLPLFGVPYSLKDLLWTKEIRTTFGSKNFENWHAPQDADLAIRLANSGGILLGKTSTPEFGLRPTTEGGLCPPARNPWNPEYTSGGSSGGAASAVASGMHPVAQGSDGGGSIRIPCACCGLFGIKPSRGRVTFAPEKAEGWGGLSTMGPIARSVRDGALMFDAMVGSADGDFYRAPAPARPFVDALKTLPSKLRFAAITKSVLGVADSEVLGAFESACATMRELGHTIEPIELDPSLINRYTRTVIGSSVSALQIENPDLLDPVVRASYDWGKKISAAEYLRALASLQNLAREIVQALIPYDALLTPTLTRPPMRVGTLPSSIEAAADEIYSWNAFLFPYNSTGQPAVSIPCGFTKSGLPLAFQVVGRPYDEAGLISIAAQFEEARPFQQNRPPIG